LEGVFKYHLDSLKGNENGALVLGMGYGKFTLGVSEG